MTDDDNPYTSSGERELDHSKRLSAIGTDEQYIVDIYPWDGEVGEPSVGSKYCVNKNQMLKIRKYIERMVF
jgi:hypothetical protein